MHKSFRILLFSAFMLLCAPLRAQWSGNIDLSAGLGGMDGGEINDNRPMIHAITQGKFQLNYDTGKFRWTTTLNGKWEPKTTDNTRMAYKNETLDLVYKSVSTKPLTASIKSDFLWTLSPTRRYSTWILYQYSNDRGQNQSMNVNAKDENSGKFSYNYEVPVMDEHKLEAGLKTFRNFGRRILESSLSAKVVGSQKTNTWIVFKTDPGNKSDGAAVNIEDVQGYAWKYRITPNSLDLDLDGDIHLQNIVLEGVSRLKLAPGLRASSKHSVDHNSGATRTNVLTEEGPEIWKDSLRLRENFDYLSVTAEPYFTADFYWKSLEAHADYACQVYARRLNNETHRQPLGIKGIYPVGTSNIKWTISPKHSLNLSNKMSVKHPDYIKVCWYDRSAGYLDQLYRGNEALYSPATHRYALDYEFKHKRFFSNTSVSFTYVENEIDQTWSNEEIDGRMYKVFRWLNSADSRSVGITEKLGWRGKVINANLGITYNQSQRTAKSNGAVKNNFDWKLTGDIAAKLGKGWSVGADAKYQSKVATFFTIFKEYCELNAYVQKEFKKFTLYLKGRDLLDTPRETSFQSEDQKEFWVEQVRSNRRLVVIGAKWNF